ncbi:acyltransferase family protein [Serratia symbiotica]|uniref:Acyltransferase n=1 Tax=Serratia symbiotica TaxID=138074 RepID=A0A068Z2Y8_9GAMM|nr:acyltransferase [Serratia symbiotica]QLH61918.1 acyltransferase [Serratia symbiotica]CDS56547.1 Putative acyltransferase (modular protein) [Serratia symbiotica]
MLSFAAARLVTSPLISPPWKHALKPWGGVRFPFAENDILCFCVKLYRLAWLDYLFKGEVKINKLVSVQMLRGLAAMAVMFFHFRWNINLVSPNVGDALFGWGAMGVDLFFIVSGFVLVLSAKNLQPGWPAVVHFIKHRLVRILPVYYFILVVSFLLCGAMSTFHYEDKVINLMSALLFHPVLPDHAPFYVNDSGFYGVRWTLNYELAFYGMMSLCLFSKYRWYLLFTAFCFLQFILPSLSGQQPSLATQGYQFWSIYLQLLTNPLMVMFIPGVFLGLAYPYLNSIPATLKRLILIAAVGCSIYFIFVSQRICHGIDGSGWYLALLLMACVINEDLFKKYTPSFFILTGNASFSLYLIHGLMNDGIGSRFATLGIEDGMPRFIASSVLSILLAVVSYRYLEKKLSGSFLKKKNVHSVEDRYA